MAFTWMATTRSYLARFAVFDFGFRSLKVAADLPKEKCRKADEKGYEPNPLGLAQVIGDRGRYQADAGSDRHQARES